MAPAPAFCVRVARYRDNPMLNICDADLLGTDVGGGGGGPTMSITKEFYGERTVGGEEAGRLMRGSSIINMVGRRAVGLAVSLGIGSEGGVKKIGGVPFLIVFNM